MTSRRSLALAGLFLLLSGEALAAPYCVDVTGIPQQCLYVDPAACQADALRQKGQCVGNASEVRAPPRSQAFCLVQSGNVLSCIYPDRDDCDRDSVRTKGACIPAIPGTTGLPAPPPGVDPYQVKRPY